MIEKRPAHLGRFFIAVASVFCTYSMHMYFAAIVLPEELNKLVWDLKMMMFNKWNCKVGLKSPAHITILPPFWMKEEQESDLLNTIDELAKNVKPFQVITNDFSVFKPRTIFIDVAPNIELDHLKNRADEHFKKHQEFSIKMENRPFHPHITIATRDMFKKTFYEAWPLFENKEFKVGWEATGICTLRHNKKNWDVIHTSQFQNNL